MTDNTITKGNQPEVMISAREPIGSRDDIWTRSDKGYDMKNDMLYVYHILQQRKCKLVILARIKYMYIDLFFIEQENYCFNIQIQ